MRSPGWLKSLSPAALQAGAHLGRAGAARGSCGAVGRGGEGKGDLPWRRGRGQGLSHEGASGRRHVFSVTSNHHENIYMTVRSGETQLTLQELINFGKDADKNTVLQSAVWLKKDLPVRMGHRVQTKSVLDLCNLYEESFVRITEHESPKTSAAEESFSKMLLDIKDKHRMVQANIAEGFKEMVREGVPRRFMEANDIQEILTKFYTGRIGVRLLIDQHLMLRQDAEEREKAGEEYIRQSKNKQAAFVGVVQTACPIKEVILDAVEDARSACKLHLRDAPNVRIDGMKDLMASYIPEHLYMILLELVKNSMRATVELHGRQSSSHEPMFGENLPPIRITITGGEDVIIRISDRGGGISPESFSRIWNFSFSTAPQGIGELAGFGHGLPLSRLYARYWGGNIQVYNMENLGLDVFVRLGVPQDGYANMEPQWKKRDRASEAV